MADTSEPGELAVLQVLIAQQERQPWDVVEILSGSYAPEKNI